MDENVALLTGQVAGLLMTLNREEPESLLDLEIEVVDGNYTNRIFVTRPSGRYTVTVDRDKVQPTHDPQDVEGNLERNPHWPHG